MSEDFEERTNDIEPTSPQVDIGQVMRERKLTRDREVQDILSSGFRYDELEWKVQVAGQNDRGVWARIVPYVTSRAIVERLDEAFGPGCYSITVTPFSLGDHQGFKAAITAEWPGHGRTTREDVSELTENEPIKGGASGAIKRAAVLYGIGRYLYTSPDFYALIHDNGQYRGVFTDKQTKQKVFFKWDLPEEAIRWVQETQRVRTSETGPTPTDAAKPAVRGVAPAPSPSSAPSSSPTASPPPSRPASTAAPATPSSPSAPAMPGRDGWFKGWAGKPITDVPVEVLEESRAYYAKRIADNPTDKWINKTKADLAAIEAELLTRDGGTSDDEDGPDFGDNPFDQEMMDDDLPY